MAVSPEFMTPPPLQKQPTSTHATTNSRSDAMASLNPVDFQHHSTPHMKTRIAVRDRTPHRFQVVPLKDRKRSSSTLQLVHPPTPPSAVRKGLQDVTNIQETTPRSSSQFPGIKRISPSGANRECNLNPLSITNPVRTSSVSSKVVDRQTTLKLETPLVNPTLPGTCTVQSLSVSVSFQSVIVKPLNIVKRSPPDGRRSSPPLTGIKPPTARSSTVQTAIKSSTGASSQDATMTAIALPPVFEFLNSPAENTPSFYKHRRRSRSSHASFSSKLPTSLARTRMTVEHLEDGGSLDGRTSNTLATRSNPTTPIIGELYTTSPDTSTTTVTESRTHAVRASIATSTSERHSEDAVRMSSKSKSWHRASKYFDSSLSKTSEQAMQESRIPSAKSKAAFHSRTLDSALSRTRHVIAHSVDVVNLKPRFIQAPRIRQYQDVRSLFPKYDDLPQTVDDKVTNSNRPSEVTPSPSPRRPSTFKSEPPSAKRHAIYTQSLYVGKADKVSNEVFRTLENMIPSRCEATVAENLTQCEDVSPAAPSDSLESILKVYQDAISDEDVQLRASAGPGLPTSHSEPTLHDVSHHSRGVSCTVIAGEPASISLSSLDSVYSQDSWTSVERQGAQSSNDRVVTRKEQKFSQTTGHHPIVRDLLEKLECAQRTWVWETGIDRF
ncbi:hypothetical protein EV360DRAFT_81919 [Lentinula raphanica]|nr:hypothetical protein EV360DRAFT_81919 [Lentinula raphanica]